MSISVVVIVSILSFLFFVVSLAPLIVDQSETNTQVFWVDSELNQGLVELGQQK
jgi:hypothetical protein